MAWKINEKKFRSWKFALPPSVAKKHGHRHSKSGHSNFMRRGRPWILYTENGEIKKRKDQCYSLMVLHFFSACSTTQTLAISSGKLLGKDFSKTNIRLDSCLCTEQQQRERGWGKVSQFRYNYPDSPLWNYNVTFFIPDALSFPLPSLPPSPALTLSGQLSKSAEAQLIKR